MLEEVDPSPKQNASSPHAGLDTDDSTALERLLSRSTPADELAEQTRSVALPLDRSGAANARLLVARLGPERIAFDVEACRRVVPPARVHRIPHRTNEIFSGLCAVDGELLLAVRLDRVLGFDVPLAADQRAARMIILGDARNSWAIPVDEVEGVRSADEAAYRLPPATVAKARDGLSKALVDLDPDDDPVALLDSALLFARLERSLG